MKPRFIIKTHTEALRPKNYSLLIAKCTYPDKSSYPEIVIKRLYPEWIKENSVAKFTVMLSTQKNRGFGFLLDNMIWSWKGHVINAVLYYLKKQQSEAPKSFEELTKMERICYLRYFLETEGAIILKFAQKFNKMGELSNSYLRENIQEIFKEIYEEYIDIAPDFRIRSRIREAQKQMKSTKRYDEGTLIHKIKPHIQALADLGILSIEKKNAEEIFAPTNFGFTSTFSIIINQLKDFQTMENMFSNNEHFPLIAQIYNLAPLHYSYETHRDLLKETISYGYQIMRDKTTGMADIDALINWSCIKVMSEDNILLRGEDVQDFLDKIRRNKPSSIRYHVNGKGKIAYIIFSESL
jgi:hypothetical protein